MKMKERLYLTEDKSKAVKEDDRAGRYLLCKKGAELNDKIAAAYGIVDGSLSGKVSVKSTDPLLEFATQTGKAMRKNIDKRIAESETKRNTKAGRIGIGSKIKSAELTVHRGKKSKAKGIKK